MSESQVSRISMLILLCGGAAVCAPAPAAGTCNLVDEVRFDFMGGQIVVPVSLGGAPPRRLLLDTGAEEHYLWSDAAAALGWKPTEKVSRRDAMTGFEAKRVRGIDVSLGRAGARGQTFIVKERTTPHADGFLGHDFIARYVVEVDYGAERLRFWEPACDRVPAGATALPLRFDEGWLPTVAATLAMPQGAPVEARLLVDTGAGVAAIFRSPFVARHHLLERATRIVDQETGGIGGGHVSLAAARALWLRLGGFELARPVVWLGRSEGSYGHGYSSDGLIGGGVLSRFVVTLDYPHRRLLLAPTPRLRDPFRFDAVAMLLEDTPAGPRVMALRRGGAADRAGLLRGDVIRALVGLKGPLTAETLYRALEAEGSYGLEIDRAGRPVRLTLKVENPL